MGWLEGGVKLSESEDVAQHSFETSTIALILTGYLEEEIDTEKVLKMAMIHDWAEAVTGDFSKEVSEQLGEDVKEKIEENVLENILNEEMPDREEYIDLWREYNERTTKEAKLVKIADKLSILIEGNYLSQSGENSEKIEKIWKKTREGLDPLGSEFNFLADLLKKVDDDHPSPE